MTSKTQSGLPADVQYEDFRPSYEWKEEKEASILNINLPDFIKEQLKITYVNSTRIIRVTGERQIAGNKWRRLNQSFPAPQNCRVDKIQAKFLNGVLTITMPKPTIIQAAQPEVSAKPTTTEEAPTPQKPAPTIPEPKEQKGLEKITGKAGTSREQGRERVETPALQEIRKDSKSQKVMEEVAGKVGTSQEEDGQKVGRTPKLKDLLEESKPEKAPIEQAPLWDERTDVKERREAIEQRRKATIREEDKTFAEQDEEVSEKWKESSIAPPETDREGSIKERKLTDVVKSKKRAMELVAGKIEEVKGAAAAAKDAVSGLAMELNEDRQKMVNIGVAVIVIASLGAYLYYRYKSSGTDKE